jgi:hypothetical protein
VAVNTETDRNGLKRNETDRNGQKRNETDGTETERNGKLFVGMSVSTSFRRHYRHPPHRPVNSENARTLSSPKGDRRRWRTGGVDVWRLTCETAAEFHSRAMPCNSCDLQPPMYKIRELTWRSLTV